MRGRPPVAPRTDARMIRRDHLKGDAASTALYSDCLTYRYDLTRVWDAGGRRAAFVMLNPSTATEAANDPTVERCERRARALGYGAMRVANVFALRATDPRVMRAHPEPVGRPENDAAILDAAAWADDVVCAWGAHGAHLGRGSEVEAMLRAAGHRLGALGLSKGGHPRHPLYVPYAVRPMPWEVGDGSGTP